MALGSAIYVFDIFFNIEHKRVYSDSSLSKSIGKGRIQKQPKNHEKKIIHLVAFSR